MTQFRHRPKISVSIHKDTKAKLDQMCPKGHGQDASKSRLIDRLVHAEFDRWANEKLNQSSSLAEANTSPAFFDKQGAFND